MKRLIALSAKWNRRQVRRIGLDEEPVRRHRPDDVVPLPPAEGHDAAEGDVPTRADSRFGECEPARVAVQYTADALRGRLENHTACVLVGVARVDHNRLPLARGKLKLHAEGIPLCNFRRVLVMVVETALAHSAGAAAEARLNRGHIPGGVEQGCVVRMDARRPVNKAGVALGESLRGIGGGMRFADADDAARARVAGAGDYFVAVAVERRVGEVRVAVEEGCHASDLRGHLPSIQRSNGAAT